jgi:hypothetical protein
VGRRRVVDASRPLLAVSCAVVRQRFVFVHGRRRVVDRWSYDSADRSSVVDCRCSIVVRRSSVAGSRRSAVGGKSSVGSGSSSVFGRGVVFGSRRTIVGGPCSNFGGSSLVGGCRFGVGD